MADFWGKQMGNIRIYDSQANTRASYSAHADAEDFGAGLGRGLRAVGRGLEREADKIEKQREQQEVSDAASSAYEDDLYLTQQYQALSEEAQPGDPTVADRWLQGVRDYFENKPQKYASPRAQQYAQQQAERAINEHGVRGLGLQASLNGQKFKNDAVLTGDAVAATVFANPNSYVGARDRLSSEAQQGVGFWQYGKPGERPQLLEQMTENAAWNAGLGTLAQAGGTERFLSTVAPGALTGDDWRGSLKTGKIDKPGYEWWNDLDPEKQIQLITKAEADHQQSRRLAAGTLKDTLDNQRAELELYGTVKNPLPRSAFAVLGDKADEEYRAYQGDLKAYGLAFEFVKLPDDQAMARIEALKPARGDVNKDNLRQYELVNGAYRKLRQAQQQDQIGVAKQRGVPGIGEFNPNDDKARVQELTLRAATVDDQSRITGKFRWLSEQEAEQQNQRLAGMGDAEIRRYFQDTRMAIKDPKKFQAYVAQIYPDNAAMRAGAGLAGKNGIGAVYEGQVYDASTVSARVMSGARYLDKKSEDGKSVRNSSLPPDETFEKTFRGVVGDAVPPEYFNDALQIAKAYYIGEGMATHSGLSSGKVDPKQMTRAVTLTLGSTTTNPDGSKVFAPWGMDATRFRNEAKARYDAVRQKYGLPGGFDSQSFAPIPGREGMYGIKLGNGISYAIDLNAPVEKQP